MRIYVSGPPEHILFLIKGLNIPFQRVREERERGFVFLREKRDPTDFKPLPTVLFRVPVVSIVMWLNMDFGRIRTLNGFRVPLMTDR